MWQRFTDEARRAMFHAHEEAHRLGAAFVDPKHLVLGLLKSETVAHKILVNLQIDIELLREALSTQEASGFTDGPGEMCLDPRSKRAIDLAFGESRSFGQRMVGTEHILLGILAGDSRPVVRTLYDLHVSTESVKRSISSVEIPPPEPPRNRTTAKPAQPFASSSLKLVSYQTSAFLALRQGVARTDYLALFLLSDRPPVLCDRLLNLGVPIHEIVTAIEVAIMMGPSSVMPNEPQSTDLMIQSGGDPCRMFLAIALHPLCNTHRAFESLGVTPDQLRTVLSVS